MRVGVDARLLGERVTGIGRYTAELLARLIPHSGHSWYLYSPRALVTGDWRGSGVTARISSMPPGRVWRMLWSQTVLPSRAYRDGLDLFWGPTHRLPPFMPELIARVVTIHDLVWRHAGATMRPLSRWLESQLMPRAVTAADIVLADSYSTAAALEEEYPWVSSKVRVVHLGCTPLPVPPNSVQIIREIGLHTPYFLFVGTMEPRKNLHRLLSAFALLPADVRESCSLVIAGGAGWGRENIDCLVNQLGVAQQVHLLGYVSDVQLAALYSQALFLAMPSLYEGFGLPLLEAMQHGIPVLTSNCSSLPEVVGNGGVMVNPLETHAIRDGLHLLLSKEDLRQVLGQNAKGIAQSLTWEQTAAKTMDVFAEALDMRRHKCRTAKMA